MVEPHYSKFIDFSHKYLYHPGNIKTYINPILGGDCTSDIYVADMDTKSKM